MFDKSVLKWKVNINGVQDHCITQGIQLIQFFHDHYNQNNLSCRSANVNRNIDVCMFMQSMCIREMQLDMIWFKPHSISYSAQNLHDTEWSNIYINSQLLKYMYIYISHFIAFRFFVSFILAQSVRMGALHVASVHTHTERKYAVC